MRSFVVAAAAVLMSTGCATGYTPRHEGVHLHADVGFVGSQSTSSNGEAKLSGPGVGFSFAVGGAVAPNVILGADLWMSTVPDPKLTDTYTGESLTATDTQYNVVGFGPQLKYYITPVNLYFSATPSLTRMTFADTESDSGYHTNMGFGFRGAFGKEWIAGPSWGMGLAGVVQFATNEDDDGFKWSTLGYGVVFSASMN